MKKGIRYGLSDEGRRVVRLVRAIRSAGAFPPGTEIPVEGEAPARYAGPAGVQEGVLMHLFRLHDGTEALLEVQSLAGAARAAPPPRAVQCQPLEA